MKINIMYLEMITYLLGNLYSRYVLDKNRKDLFIEAAATLFYVMEDYVSNPTKKSKEQFRIRLEQLSNNPFCKKLKNELHDQSDRQLSY